MPPTGRLAPTPSGALHLGNALAFGAAWLSVRNAGGRLLLRVEDLDRGRARREVEEGQKEDLRWLGLEWDAEVTRQSERVYPLDGVPTFRCDCNRARRLAGQCRCRDEDRAAGAWRYRCPGGPVQFVDRVRGSLTFAADDPILLRADGEAAYPLAVVLDDHRDGVTEVVRGADLLEATATQVAIHHDLGLTPPSYLHVPVLLGPDGKKLSKSLGAVGVRAWREAGRAPQAVWAFLLPFLGIEADNLADAVLIPSRIPSGPFVIDPVVVEELRDKA